VVNIGHVQDEKVSIVLPDTIVRKRPVPVTP